MEQDKSNFSDKDKSMMNSFESFDDSKTEKSKDKDKKEDKKKSSAESSKEITLEKKAEAPKPKSLAELFKIDQKTDEAEGGETESEDLGELDPTEERVAAAQIVDAQLGEVATEEAQTPEGTAEAAEVAADQALLEELSNQLEDEAIPFAEALENAGQKVMAELEPDEPEDDEDEPVTVTPPPKGPPPPTPPVSGGISGNLPPLPPSPGNRLPPHPLGPLGGPNYTPGPTPNLNVQPASPNVGSEWRHNKGSDLLIGGVIGYLIGRRRGRIRTQERLLPIQEKLEQQVQDLQAQIVRKEEQVRTFARERFWAQKNRQPTEATAGIVQERENTPLRSPEKFGKVVVGKMSERALNLNEKLSQAEVLAAAASIEIDGTTLRRMYETHALDEVGLRKVVEAYIRGDSYKEVLAREIIGRETQTEKSIERDKDGALYTNNQTTSPQADEAQRTASTSANSATNTVSSSAAPKPKQKFKSIQTVTQNPRFWVTLVVVAAVILLIIFLR